MKIPQNVPKISISTATKIFPRRVTEKTLRRWATNGLRGHVLPTIAKGDDLFTTHDAVEDFISKTMNISPEAGAKKV